MKRIFLLMLSILWVHSSFADEDKTLFFHVHPTLGEEKLLLIKYVECSGEAVRSSQCNNPTEKEKFVDYNGNAYIKIPNKDDSAVIVTSVVLRGKTIWGPYPKEYEKNICNTAHGYNSLNFFLNSRDPYSLTCIPGLGI